jgi:hypothetical protein
VSCNLLYTEESVLTAHPTIADPLNGPTLLAYAHMLVPVPFPLLYFHLTLPAASLMMMMACPFRWSTALAVFVLLPGR